MCGKVLGLGLLGINYADFSRLITTPGGGGTKLAEVALRRRSVVGKESDIIMRPIFLTLQTNHSSFHAFEVVQVNFGVSIVNVDFLSSFLVYTR